MPLRIFLGPQLIYAFSRFCFFAALPLSNLTSIPPVAPVSVGRTCGGQLEADDESYDTRGWRTDRYTCVEREV